MSGKTVPVAGIIIPGITLRVETNLQSIYRTISFQHFHAFACLYVSKTSQKYELMLQFENNSSYFFHKMTLKKCLRQQTDIKQLIYKRFREHLSLHVR